MDPYRDGVLITGSEIEKYYHEVSELTKGYRLRLVKRLELPSSGEPSHLGANGILGIQQLLSRSHALNESALSAFDRKHLLGAALATRAHVETTGMIAMFGKKLNQFYEKELEAKDFEPFLKSLLLGSKTIVPDEDWMKVPPPVQVLTAIDSVDGLLKEIGIKDKVFRGNYDQLSELCHPNHIGTSYITATPNSGWGFEFIDYALAYDQFHQGIVPILAMSLQLLFKFFDGAFHLLEKNERLPKIIR